MDIKAKVAVMKFIGELMSNPDKFRKEIEFTAVDEVHAVTGTFKATGAVAEFLRGSGNVQKTLEA